jgi:hypothetical protein
MARGFALLLTFMHHREGRFEIAREACRVEEGKCIAIARKLCSDGSQFCLVVWKNSSDYGRCSARSLRYDDFP